MKHAPETHTLSDIVGYIDQQNGCMEFSDIMALDIPGIAEFEDVLIDDIDLDDDEVQAAFDAIQAIARDYIRLHADDLYEVLWPEHVITKRFNSDATYRLWPKPSKEHDHD